MRAAIVLVLGAAAVTVGIGMVRTAAQPTEALTASTAPTTSPATVDEDAPVYVHVHGAVGAAGLYRVAAGARVVDAVAAAGGFAETADRGAVNLAREVQDGEQIVIPEVGAQPAAGPPPGTSPGAGGGTGGASGPGAPIDLNTADAAALDTLPRIGPALASRIIAWREQNGRFTSVDDLLAVPGIGEKMLQSLRDLVRV